MESEEARQHLSQERERLFEVRSELLATGITEESEEESLSDPSSNAQHPANVGTETFDRERDLSILEQVEAELVDVERALARLDEGTYGICEVCGKPVEEARLEVLPAARFCIQHQQDAERDVHRPA